MRACADMFCMFRTTSSAHGSRGLGQRSHAHVGEDSRPTPAYALRSISRRRNEPVIQPQNLAYMLFLGQKLVGRHVLTKLSVPRVHFTLKSARELSGVLPRAYWYTAVPVVFSAMLPQPRRRLQVPGMIVVCSYYCTSYSTTVYLVTTPFTWYVSKYLYVRTHGLTWYHTCQRVYVKEVREVYSTGIRVYTAKTADTNSK